jgi:predicted RND superfamily exporter protein
LRVETDFSRNFRASSPIVTSLEFVETRLGGAGTWEVNFAVPPRADEAEFAALLDRVRALLIDLRGVQREFPQLTKVTGLTDGLDLVPERIGFFAVSLDTRLSIMGKLQPEFVPSLYDAEAGRMRIVLRALERQPAEEKQRLIDTVESRARAHFPEARTTGLFVLLTFLIESLMGSQVTSFAITAAAVAGMMAIAFRSVRIGLISLVPNVFPIVLVIGTMGWTGLPINIATAMISSVSLGLTVDSSIHYLAGWRRAQQSGLDPREALAVAHAGVGKSLVLANVALIAGFAVLTASHFIPLVYFGFLVGVAIFGGLVGNLVLLPLMLRGMLPATDAARHPARSGSPGVATPGLPE